MATHTVGEVLDAEPRDTTIQAIEDFIEFMDPRDASRSEKGNTWLTPNAFGVGATRHAQDVFDAPMPDGAKLTVSKTVSIRSIFGRQFRPKTSYQVIYKHPAAFREFPEDTPPEEAPSVGYERWCFSTDKPNELTYNNRTRRYDHYEQHGEQVIKTGPVFDHEFKNATAAIKQAFSQALVV